MIYSSAIIDRIEELERDKKKIENSMSICNNITQHRRLTESLKRIQEMIDINNQILKRVNTK
jgi:hypothetical protein